MLASVDGISVYCGLVGFFAWMDGNAGTRAQDGCRVACLFLPPADEPLSQWPLGSTLFFLRLEVMGPIRDTREVDLRVGAHYQGNCTSYLTQTSLKHNFPQFV